MAGSIIKGLTVEIGGDTTKLGKALEDVEKKSRGLSAELGQINKLLKMDPGNADLLAQKQQVLTEAVANTSEKLDKLKQAEAQVQEQFKRGEVSEEQVRALQREIIATTKKLDSYERAAAETADELKQLGDGSDDVKKGAKDVKKGADQAADGLDDYADSAEKAEKAGGGLAKAGAVVGKGLAAVGAAAGAAIGAMVGAAEATREYRTEMGKLDTAFTTAGHSSEAATETYKTLQGVLGESDQAVEAANHLAKLASNEEELAEWTNVATGVYATFGASLPIESLTEAANETAKTGVITGSLADALNWAGISEEAFQAQLDECTTEQEHQALILNTLNGLYSDAADKYRETNAEVIRANEANEAWMASMAGVGGAIEPILTDVKLLGASLVSDLVPGVQSVADAFRGVLNGDAGAADALGGALSGLVTSVLTKVTEMLPTVVEVAMSLLTTLTTTIISMIPQLVTTGVEIIMAIMNGLTTAIPQIVQAVADMIPQLVQALVTGIPLLIQGAVQLLLAILQAIPQIIPPLVEALPQLVMALINGLLAAIPQLIQGAVQFLMAIVQAIPLILDALVPQIPVIVTALVEGLAANIPVLLQGALQLLQAIVDAIPLILDALVPQIPLIIDTIVDLLIDNIPVLLQAAVQLFWQLILAVGQIVVELGKRLPDILKAIQKGLDAIPRIIGELLGKALKAIGPWVTDMAGKAKEMGKKFIDNVVNFFKTLPSKIGTWLQNVISKVVTWSTNMVSKAKQAAKNVVTSVIDGFKSLPSKVAGVGKDLVQGLWNGIKDMTTWVKNKIKGFSESVLDGIKDFFGIHSPSKVFKTQIGQQLVAGMIEGIDSQKANANKSAKQLGELYVSAAKEKISSMKEVNALTLADEIAFWEEIQDHCVEGTDAYEDAAHNAAKARLALATDVKKLDDQLATDKANLKDKLEADIKAVLDAYDAAVESRKKQVASSMGLTDIFKAEEGKSKQQLTQAIKSQVEGLREWDEVLDALSKRKGMDADLLADLQSMDAKSVDTLKQFNEMTDEELAQYIALYKEKNRIAEERAIVEAEDLRAASDLQIKALNEEADAQLQALEQTYVDNLAALGVTVAANAEPVGASISEGIAAGINNSAELPLKALSDLVESLNGTAAGFNGLTLDSQLQYTFNPPASAASAESGLLAKLDRILEAVERGQVLTIDGETLVGSTLHTYDNKLGQRRMLATRGAL